MNAAMVRLLRGNPREELGRLGFAMLVGSAAAAPFLAAGALDWPAWKPVAKNIAILYVGLMLWGLATLGFTRFLGPSLARYAANREAQLSLFGMFSFLIGLIVYAAILPILNAVINDAAGNIGTLGQLILYSTPLLLLLGLVMSLLFYIRPQYPPPY